MKTKEDKLKTKLDRLGEPGYYVTYYGERDTDLSQPETFGVDYIAPNGKCRYIHWGWGKEWGTLMWTCAPTKNKIAKASAAKPSEELDRYLYFETHEDLCKFPHIKNKPGALIDPTK